MMKALVVGLGSIGSRHARILRELVPDASIMALRHGGSTEPRDGVDYCVNTLADALAFCPDVAVIANPATHHLPVATALAEAGTHLLVEKPIAARLDGVSQLIETCGRQSRVLMTGYNLRFTPSLNSFRDVILSGAIGRILSVRAEVGSFLPSWRPSSDYRQTVSAKRELGGGALLELSHELDYLRWIFGDVAWVSGVVSRQSDLEIDVEDTVHATLGFVAPAKRLVVASLTLDFVRHDQTRSCHAVGTQGSARWNALEGTVDVFKQADAWRTVFSQRTDRDYSYREEWRHFLQCVRESRVPLASGEDGLAVLKVVDAIRISSEQGRRCEIA